MSTPEKEEPITGTTVIEPDTSTEVPNNIHEFEAFGIKVRGSDETSMLALIVIVVACGYLYKVVIDNIAEYGKDWLKHNRGIK